MTTPGYPTGEEPEQLAGGFAPGPSPLAADGGAGGWSYSFDATGGYQPAAPAAEVPSAASPVSAGAEWQSYAASWQPEPATAPAYEAVHFDPAEETQQYAASAFEALAQTGYQPAGAEPSAYTETPYQASYQPSYEASFDQSYGVAPVAEVAVEQPSTTSYLLAPEAAAPAPVPLSLVPEPEPEAFTLGPVVVEESEADEEAYARASTEAQQTEDDLNLNEILEHVVQVKASDLHITSGTRPTIRLHGELTQLEDYPVMTPPVIQRVMYAILTQKQREKFEEELELDFSYSVPGRARFRVNLYRQRDALGAAFRLIPYEIKKLEELGVPPVVANFAQLPRGFVLVTGPTGSGKSTTLAAIIDLANRTRKDHIMTVEDPIEFLHRHQSCVVNQREVGEDTWSFQNALKHVLRQDPDIILVGEMRDLETISVALTAAETGHLVFATLHTQDAAQTIDRVIDVFPPHQQQQVRVQLAGAIQGVVCQTLCKTPDGKGRVVATEVMTATPAIRNLIREGKTHQIYSAMQAGQQHGMHTLDQHLADLVRRGQITYEHGLEKCHHVEDFNRLTGRA
ncbi:MAG: PilT/PilU family type 4a pilus ATPase [Motilibacteraceae bacterium]